jgi:hypothetical protein
MKFSALLFSIVLAGSIESLDQSRKVLIEWYNVDSESTFLARKYEDYISQDLLPTTGSTVVTDLGLHPGNPRF